MLRIHYISMLPNGDLDHQYYMPTGEMQFYYQGNEALQTHHYIGYSSVQY